MTPDASPSSECARLAGFDSATISNAIETLAVRHHMDGYASGDLVCQLPELPPMVGYAVTCRHLSASKSGRKTEIGDLIDLLGSSPKPAVVVFQFVGSDAARHCAVGDIVSTAVHRLGGVGIVTDSGCRDLAGIRRRAPGFQVFARGPVVSHGDGIVCDVGSDVVVGGLPVSTGDLLHGDANGLVAVPAGRASDVAAAAQAVVAAEASLFELFDTAPLDLDAIKRRFAH
jgi:regulator of RNase E activity RraA